MKTPFTAEQFLGVFKHYNEAVFPLQLSFYLFVILIFYLVSRHSSGSNKIISIILSFFWLWMGVVYHLIYFTPINKAAYLFGAVFILQGILFLILGVFQSKLSFSFSFDKYGIAGTTFIVYALIVYPALGYFYDHVYPASPTFGLPCPTTIFTFGILLLSTKKCPVSILIIPLVWSIIGSAAVLNFGIIEDAGLMVTGVLSFSLLLIRNRK